MEISRSGYYKWLNRKDILNRYEQDREILSNIIKEYHKIHKSWGHRRIAREIRKDIGWVFSDNLCHKCCKAMNIGSIVRKKRNKNKGEEHIIYPNIISNNWKVTRPFEKICTDTTIFYNHNKAYDLTFYLDAFNNEILVYDLVESKHGSDSISHIKALKKLIKVKIKRGYKTLETIVHSDQGVIYTSRAYANAHKDYTIIRSMSRLATPTDNPKIESINGWIKDELFTDYNLRNTGDVHKTIREYIKYYNNERLAYALNYKSPVQYRTELSFN